MIHQQLNKRLLRRPYLKYGQCPALWGYLFELGGILGAKYTAKLDAFGPAFLGAHGDAGALGRFCTDVASDLVERGRINGTMKFFDYVQAEYVDRFPDYAGDTLRFFRDHGMDKIRPEPVAGVARHFASQGVALGAIHPDLVRAMFERTYAVVSKEQWEGAYAAGLNIGPEQPRKSYDEAEEEEDKEFMTFCAEFRPELCSMLSE
jgi:hypothetical protein